MSQSIQSRSALTAEELRQQKISAARQRELDGLFSDRGVLLVDNVFDAEALVALAGPYFERYASASTDELEATCVRVGQERYMVTVPLEPPFDQPWLYANPIVKQLVRGWLGEHFVLNSFGSVIAFPGAPAQHTHVDHPRLFAAQGLDTRLPPYAVTMIVPLMPITERNGGTQVWEGSHRVPGDAWRELSPSLLVADPGASLFMDYRVWHGGAANRAQVPRPLLYVVYSRPWFRDAANFYRQRPIEISDETLEGVSPEHLHLFATVAPERARRQRSRVGPHDDF